MNKIGTYEVELVNMSPRKWDAFLKDHSHLPGPEANVELARAFARVGTLMDFKKYIRLDSDEAPENTPDEFLVFCGVLGYGQYLSKYHDGGLLAELKEKANDSRRSIRRAVVLALQMIGKKKISRLRGYLKIWIEGTFLEQRAAVVAMCGLDLSGDHDSQKFALELLEWATATMVEFDDRQGEEYHILREALNRCWSIAVAALPEKGKPMIERWIKQGHPVVNSIMRENLQSDRLYEIDKDWVSTWRNRITD